MLAMDASIDLIVPRGGNAFVRHIMDHTRIPVLGHADGICHVYIDRDADPQMAVEITTNSSTRLKPACRLRSP